MQVATPRMVLLDAAQHQLGASLADGVADQVEQMRRRHVDRLHAPQVDDHIAAGADLLFEVGIELVGVAEEQAALQFKNDRLVAPCLKNGEFGLWPVPA